MSRTRYAAILEAVESAETIIIHRHKRPDPDAIGSQSGLAEIIKATYPEKRVLKAGGPVGDLDFMAEMDDVADEDYKEALVIVTDTANRPRISDERYGSGKKLIKIDHHPDDDRYGDISVVDINASSCSEMIADLYVMHKSRLKMPDEAARLLYAGIVGDTGRFLYPSTTTHTMRISAELMEYDFLPSQVNNQLNEMTEKVAKLSGYVLQNLEIDETGFGKVVLTREIMENYDVSDSDTSSVVPLPGKIEDVLLWGIFVQQQEGYYRCRLRSKGPVVNEVAKQHHGGGHPLASGANAKDLNEVEQICQKLIHLANDWTSS